jgi:uncharacterized membrane protein
MQTPAFRRQLRQEASKWEQEDLIDRNLYLSLADRYQFDQLEEEAGNRFVTILTGLGFVLIGLGVLSFVAANWQYLGKTWRIVMMLTAFVAINTTGYYLWRQTAFSRLGTNQQRFGEGLLLLGALLFGANTALLAQLFNIGGDVGVLLMGWSIGVLIMAYLLRMASLGVFSLVVMGLGYWSLALNTGNTGALAATPLWTQLTHSHMPIFAAVVFGLLAYRCRSIFLYVLASIAWLTALQFTVVRDAWRFDSTASLWGVALVCALPPLCLWAIGRLQSQTDAAPEGFSRWSQRLAIFSAGLTCFLLSLDYFMSGVLYSGQRGNKFMFNWQVDQLLFVVVAIILWVLLWQKRSRIGWGWADTSLLSLSVIIGSCVVLMGFGDKQQMNFYAPGIFFVLLAAITLGCIRAGLLSADRGAFYFGWFLLTTRIFTWFAFTQTDLMLKSLLFILGGVATIAVGWWFERKLRQSRRLPS